MDDQHKVSLALGSNLGDRIGNLRAAISGLEPYMKVMARSSVYETPPAYVTDQPSFLNAAITGVTRLSPVVLLHTIKEIERQVGRAPTYRYGPRVIDIDIIFYNGERISTPELIIPHPRANERAFVLRPLMDIIPDYVDPATSRSVKSLFDSLPAANDCVLIDDKL